MYAGWIFEDSTFYFVVFFSLTENKLIRYQKKRWTLNLTFAERWWGRTGDGGGTVGVKQQSLSTLSSPACSSSLQLLVSPSSLQTTTILQANTNFTKQITSMYKLTAFGSVWSCHCKAPHACGDYHSQFWILVLISWRAASTQVRWYFTLVIYFLTVCIVCFLFTHFLVRPLSYITWL